MNLRFILLVGLLGCGSKPKPQVTVVPQARELGTYRFTERVSDSSPSLVLEGTVEISDDTVDVMMSPGICRYDEQSGASSVIRYRCGDVILSLDRTYPATRNWYQVSMVVQVPVRVCVRYETTPQGVQRCAQYGTSYEERRVTRSGRLRLNRVG